MYNCLYSHLYLRASSPWNQVYCEKLSFSLYTQTWVYYKKFVTPLEFNILVYRLMNIYKQSKTDMNVCSTSLMSSILQAIFINVHLSAFPSRIQVCRYRT